ncbi:MAG TPA: glucans biosynthesis glucosyltransferase MdoH [Dongiaceae bacterium]|nr:glucans biosynthesis glucosyltransferase MdoH [Dongiaceae bacterium]
MEAPAPEAGAPPVISPLPRVHRGWRVFIFLTSAVLLTGVVAMLFADLLWRTGWSGSRTFLLVLFVILFLLAAIGCMTAIFGFVLRRLGDRRRITGLGDYRNQDISAASTAIIFPVYNESATRVCENLRATYESLERTGQGDRFDFFILSDSTNPDSWAEEEHRWCQLVRDLHALGRIYYRRRIHNTGKKSGNVSDFLKTWGRRYRYFVCCDADSVMRGDTLVDLVKLMEAHPPVGLIQTVPALINSESLFGRIQQFSNRLYAPIFITGLNFWAQSFGNYWGHNAIIRTEPFMQYCDLPQLPGRKPFGGQILSHDFVEAALLLKENWQVWLAYDLEGSYEESPQGLIENAQRDRRWCQGNLQHTMVLFARGFRSTSRLHLLLGIFGYLASPLWLMFLLTYNWMRWVHERSGLSEISVRGFIMHVNPTVHALIIFIICMCVLMLPKVLALLDLAVDRKRRREYGGQVRATASAVLETVFSTLHAPLQMLWHTQFVVTSLLGMSVNWSAQKREADGTTWGYALQRHWGHTVIGLGWGGLVFWLDRAAFWWFVPVVTGMVASIPLSVWTSRSTLGARARNAGLFLTPEETAPPAEINGLRDRLTMLEIKGETATRPVHSGLAAIILDPYVNAIHVSLLREKRLNPAYAAALEQLGVGTPEVRSLAEKMLREGPQKMPVAETRLVLSDADVVVWLHRQAWLRPPEKLAAWWQPAIRRYAR